MSNQPLNARAYPYSQTILTKIANRFDSTNTTSGYTTTNPNDGSSGYSVELRTNWANYLSSSSGSYPIYLQRYMYMYPVYDSMKSLQSASGTAANSMSLSDAQSAIKDASSFTDQISSFKSTIYDYADKGDQYVSIVQIAFSVYYGVVIGCAAAMVFGTVFFAFCGCNKCRCISHFGWCILTLLMILGFLLATIFFPFSVVFIESCDLIKLDSIKADGGIIPSAVWAQVQICFSQDGNLYSKYNLDTKMQFATDAMSSFNLIDQLYNNVTSQLIYNTTDAFIGSATSTRDVNPGNASPTLFQSASIMSSLSGNCMGDTIVWVEANCSGTTVYTPGATANGLCVVLMYISPSNFSTVIGSRYSSVISTFLFCSAQITLQRFKTSSVMPGDWLNCTPTSFLR